MGKSLGSRELQRDTEALPHNLFSAVFQRELQSCNESVLRHAGNAQIAAKHAEALGSEMHTGQQIAARRCC
jgi:hypothetical protein